MNEEIYLSVIIPAYNEETLIERTLIEIENFLLRQCYNYEIIVIDDRSKDKTFSILKNLKPSFKNLIVVQNDKNQGKGCSVKRGMLLANGKFRLFMDADNSTSIDQIKNFLPFLENGCDIVIGNRKLKESEIKKHQIFYKKLFGNIGNILIRILTVPKINDTQCGFKCFSVKFVKNIFPKLTIDRWGFDIEILAIANKLGYKIKTVPVVWENKEKTRVHFRDYLFTFMELLKIKINLLRKKYDY